jgi:hypothetical protein
MSTGTAPSPISRSSSAAWSRSVALTSMCSRFFVRFGPSGTSQKSIANGASCSAAMRTP